MLRLSLSLTFFLTLWFAVTMPKLSDVSGQGDFLVQQIEDRGEETIRLKRLGICQNRRLQVLNTGDPMIVRVVGTRVGISRQLAGHVAVSAAGESANSDQDALSAGSA